MFEELTDERERSWAPAIDVERNNGDLVIRADVRRSQSRRPLPEYLQASSRPPSTTIWLPVM
jgi:hypothetical protein